MRTAFSLLLSVSLDIEDEDKYNLEQDNPEDTLIALAIQNDDLHKYETSKRKDAEYCILTAAKLIAAFVEETLSEGALPVLTCIHTKIGFQVMIGAWRR